MRSMVLACAFFASSSASAIEPEMLPRFAANQDQPAPAATAIAAQDLVARGVPVEAVIGDQDTPFAWVARIGNEEAALNGFDPVTFFEPGGPRPGAARLRAEYHGGVFYFTSERHRDLFVNAPELYAPAFGGYDPELLAAGSLLPASPENWTVHNGRLFLSGTPALKRDFDSHRPEVIKAAQEKWKAVDEMFEDRFFKAHQD